jgi:hypothetical protein
VSELPFRVAADGHYRVRAVMGIIHRPGMPTWRGDGHTYSLVLLPCTQKGGAQRK